MYALRASSSRPCGRRAPAASRGDLAAHTAQAEGGEQGDPLMPLLYCLGAKRALDKVAAQLQPGESLFAYLDDVYALCQPQRAREVYDVLARALREENNISLHEAKTRFWNKAGIKPDRIDSLGDEVWNPDGVKLLGTPVGG